MIGISISIHSTHRAESIIIPEAFAEKDWRVSDAATDGSLLIAVVSLPAQGGSPLSEIQYSLDDGRWTDLGAAETGVFAVVGLTNGQAVSVRLRAVNLAGPGEASAQKLATPTASAIAPTNLVAPSISGDAAVGQTLVVDDGLWSGLPAPTLSRIWRRDGVAIPGATGSHLALSAADAGAAIDVLVTATNASGSAEAAAPAVFAVMRTPIIVKSVPAQTGRTGDWFGLDVSEFAASSSRLTFGLADGAAPDGLTLERETGMLHGVPAAGGDYAFAVRVSTPDNVRDLPVSLSVSRMTTLVSGGFGLTRASALGLAEGAGLRRKMTFAARFMVPGGWAEGVTLFHMLGRTSVRIFTNGKVSVTIQKPDASVDLVNWTSASAGAVNTGTEHLLVVTADLSDAAPIMTVSLDGVEMPGVFSVAPTAGEMAVNRPGYGVGTRTDGALPMPPGGALRWIYLSFEDAIPAADFLNAADPASLGSPTLFFGGAVADWNAGTNFGALGGVFTPVGTFVEAEPEVIPDPRPLAFPGAVGFGRFATGGRGAALADTYRVTSIGDNVATPGTLRHALAQPPSVPGAPIYIIIEAEGACEISSAMTVVHPNTTLDARRAPGLGFWLAGAGLRTRASNVVHLGLRSFPGSNFDGIDFIARDAFRLDGDIDLADIYYHQCDAAFGTDEVWSCFPSRTPALFVQRVTLHDCIIFESCHESLHVHEASGGLVDNHGKALLFNEQTSKMTFFGGVVTGHNDRTPRLLGIENEWINATIADFGATAVQVSVNGGSANFINTAWIIGPVNPSNASTLSSKWLAGTPTNDLVEVVYEAGEFSGSWSAAGGFDDAAMLNKWRINGGRDVFLQDIALQNANLFVRSGADALAQTAQAAFLSVNARIGARNRNGERHPFTERVVRYLSSDVLFAAGWHGGADGAANGTLRDEVRAIGASVSGGVGGLTVTLPDANIGMPPVSNRPWTAVEVSVVDYWAGPVVLGAPLPAKTGKGWADAAPPVSGSLSGGAVVVSGLAPGWYTIRVVYYAGSVAVPLYTGRPVGVA